MWGADGGSGYNVPLRIIPDRSEPPEHLIQSASAKGSDVFDDDPRRPDFIDEAPVFVPEAGTLAVEAGAFAGDGDILAGEAAADDIGNNSVCCQARSGEGSNIVIDRHSGPMFRQDGAGERFDLAEGHGRHAGAFEPEGEAADAAE